MKRGFIIFCLLSLLSAVCTAQKVSNIVVSQEGKNIVITYDLSENANIRISGTAHSAERTATSKVSLQMSAVKGDVGKFVRAGKGKRIVWNVLSDYGDKFIFNDVQFTVQIVVPKGAISGLFSISDTKRVYFSQGNLQYQASTDTWRFAKHQYDYVGNHSLGTVYDNGVKCNNNFISSTYYSGWIDLFGWGTGNNPTNHSTSYLDYSAFTDWGVNKISNEGNIANQWRTLTYDEWKYLLHNRNDASNLRGRAVVNSVNGYVLLPDSWSLPSGLSFIPNTKNWETNIYSINEWQQMENSGAVFLPAAGDRYGIDVDNVGLHGNYWSSISELNGSAWFFLIDLYSACLINISLYYGFSVRLVKDCE